MIRPHPALHGIFHFLLLGLLFHAGVLSASTEDRLDHRVVPIFESITLELDPSRLEYAGSVKIELEVREATDQFRFHAEDIQLSAVSMTRGGKEIPIDVHPFGSSQIEIQVQDPLESGSIELAIEFSTTFDPRANSLYRMEADGLWYAFTQFESIEARKAFPCWDEPIFKIPYRVTLVVPEGNLAIANTPIESTTNGEGWKRIRFRDTPPLPSYLLAFAVGPFDTVPIPGMSIPGRVVTIKGRSHLAGEAVKTTPPILAAIEEYFDQKYPFEKLDLIAVPEFWYGGMENPGAVTYAERILLLDPNSTGSEQRRSLASVTAHELAHMWFGDLVTMAWWDDIWLNESFASWMASKIGHEVFPEYRLDVSQVRKVQRAMITDARPSTHAIRRPIEDIANLLQSADILAYSKGESILTMFERYLGPETFRRAVIDYIESNEWGNATAEDLWTSLSRESGKDLFPAMTTFLDQAGVPLVKVELSGKDRLRVRQSRFGNYGVPIPEEKVWKIPVLLKFADERGIHLRNVFLETGEQIVELDAEGNIEWVLPNAGMHGYFRWSVPPRMLDRLVGGASDYLDARERVGLIGELSAMLDAAVIGGDDYLRYLNSFADDPDPQVIGTLLGALEKVREAFVTGSNEEIFALYVQRTLGPALKLVGMVSVGWEDEEITRFRPDLLDWLGDEGRDRRVLEYADSLARAYMADPASIDPSLKMIVLDLAAINGNRELFDRFREHFETAKDPTERALYLYALGQFRDPALVEEALAYMLEGPVRPMEIFRITRAIGNMRAYDDRLFEWMTDHYDAIVSRVPVEFAAMLPYLAGGCSEERLKRAEEFFSDPANQVPGTMHQLEKITDQVNNCANLREREGDAVSAYLEGFLSSD